MHGGDTNVRVLVVDDFKNIARTLKSQFRQLGFANVDVAVKPYNLATLKQRPEATLGPLD